MTITAKGLPVFLTPKRAKQHVSIPPSFFLPLQFATKPKPEKIEPRKELRKDLPKDAKKDLPKDAKKDLPKDAKRTCPKRK